MELNELIMLGACSVIGRNRPGAKNSMHIANDDEITLAVRTAKKIWLETVKQEREE